LKRFGIWILQISRWLKDNTVKDNGDNDNDDDDIIKKLYREAIDDSPSIIVMGNIIVVIIINSRYYYDLGPEKYKEGFNNKRQALCLSLA